MGRGGGVKDQEKELSGCLVSRYLGSSKQKSSKAYAWNAVEQAQVSQACGSCDHQGSRCGYLLHLTIQARGQGRWHSG